MTNEEFLRKFDAGEKFDEDEIEEMCWGEVGEFIKERIVDELRWFLSKETIFQVEDRFFSISWLQGATECQENEYDDSYPVEVRRVEKVAYDYVPIKEEE